MANLTAINRYGLVFNMKNGLIFARIKKGWGRGEMDTKIKLNQAKELNNIELNNIELNNIKLNNDELVYKQSKNYELELINQYNTELI